jgi:hypothetical protein
MKNAIFSVIFGTPDSPFSDFEVFQDYVLYLEEVFLLSGTQKTLLHWT